MILRGYEQASRISEPSEQISAGYQTPLDKFPRFVALFWKNFSGISDPTEQLSMNYVTAVMHMGSIYKEKFQRMTICATFRRLKLLAPLFCLPKITLRLMQVLALLSYQILIP
jgi:hypothetical protein